MKAAIPKDVAPARRKDVVWQAVAAAVAGLIAAVVTPKTHGLPGALLVFVAVLTAVAWCVMIGEAVKASRRLALERCPACGTQSAERVTLFGLGYQFHRCLSCRAAYRQPAPPPDRGAPWSPSPVVTDPWLEDEAVASEDSAPFGPLLGVKRRLRAAWQRTAPAGVDRRFAPPEVPRPRSSSAKPQPPIGEQAALTLSRLLRAKQRLNGCEWVEADPSGSLWDPWLDV